MAVEGPQMKLVGYTASADLSAKQFYFVKISGARTVTVCSAVTDIPIGVLQNAPASGQAAEVCVIGHTKVSSDGTLTRGTPIGTSSDGQAVTYAAGTDTTKYLVGHGLVSTTTAGDIVEAYINCASPARGA